MRLTSTILLSAAIAAVSVTPVHALPVTVQEIGIGANETVTISSSTLGPGGINVYAGVLKLKVNGVPTDAFCIDPWHYSSNSLLPFDLVPLASAPKDPLTGAAGPGMGPIAAHEIEQLWQQFYSPGMDNLTAAALQIEIWNIVDQAIPDGSFALLTVDAALTTKIALMDTFLLSNPSAPAASLQALTSGTIPGHAGQDYVIPSVVDGARTALLLVIGLLSIGLVRRMWAARINPRPTLRRRVAFSL